ncbi:hypothetical protein [Gordonia sp. 852002-10350_SCH5691597]|uniref:hypothetical protein n=1 Tax=Gordonia sp. 852002-10350_SCH5691597 TaxID=1834085 RepID=UPI000AD1A3A2|nr:hypothetical protein [Gordonia sp. 852002-10350_SCH5691597]
MHVLNRAQLTRGVVALWPVTLLCAVLGGLAGALTQTGNSAHSAEAMVRLEQPASVSAVLSGQPTSTDELQSYVSGEIAYLSGSGFRESVKSTLGSETDPSISAVQNSNSAVVTISATAPTEIEAKRIVETAITTYLDHSSGELRDRNTAALNSINNLITQQQSTGRGAGVQELRTQASALQLQTAAGAPAIVVQPATPTSGSSSNWGVTAIIGAVVGALVALGGAVVWRNRKRFITSSSDVSDIAKTFTPTLAIGRPGSFPSESEKAAARSFFAQLGSPDSGTIVVVGASPESGTRRVGELIAGASAHHDAVQVVECLSLGVDPDLADHLRHADYVVVVAQQYVDRLPALTSTLNLLPVPESGFIAVTRKQWRLALANSKETEQPRESQSAVIEPEHAPSVTDDDRQESARGDNTQYTDTDTNTDTDTDTDQNGAGESADVPAGVRREVATADSA